MILVAAAAMGCRTTLSVCHASERSAFDEFRALLLDWSAETSWGYAQKPLFLALLATPIITMMSLALIPIRLRGPRPQRRRLAHQPGLLAACSAGLPIVFVGLPVVVAAPPAGAGWGSLLELLVSEWKLWYLTILGGLAVLVSWMTLLVGLHWRAEPSGVDRLGRTLGIFWIVVGFAVGAGLLILKMGGTDCKARSLNPPTATVIGQTMLHIAGVTMPFIAGMTLALIPIRLFGPRPRWHRLAHQPGLLASGAAGLAMAIVGLPAIVVAAALGAGWMETLAWLPDEENMALLAKFGGMAVTASWMTLLVGRRWRAESSWVDRLGRAIGVCWIVAGLAVATSEVLIETGYVLTEIHRGRDSSWIQAAVLHHLPSLGLWRVWFDG